MEQLSKQLQHWEFFNPRNWKSKHRAQAETFSFFLFKQRKAAGREKESSPVIGYGNFVLRPNYNTSEAEKNLNMHPIFSIRK